MKYKAPRKVIEEWRRRVMCSMTAIKSEDPLDQGWPVDAHHIVKAQALRRHEIRLHLPAGTLIYDHLLSVPVTRRRHERIHSYHEPLLESEIPQWALQRLREIGLKPTLNGW